MKLVLSAPAHYRPVDDTTLEIALGSATPRGIVRLTHPLRIAEDPQRFMQELLSRDLPEGGFLVEIAANEGKTYSHFPLVFVQAQVAVRGPAADAGATIVESRLAAFYRFLEFAAAAVVMKLEPRFYREHHLEFVDVLSSARPDFRGGEPAALSELWDAT